MKQFQSNNLIIHTDLYFYTVSCRVTDNKRLHQPVKNPISDNSNILWNSPSLGINSRYRLP